MVFVRTVEFRYYVVIIILVNFGKTKVIRTKAVEIDQLSMSL